jgi:hypothetical protein
MAKHGKRGGAGLKRLTAKRQHKVLHLNRFIYVPVVRKGFPRSIWGGGSTLSLIPAFRAYTKEIKTMSDDVKTRFFHNFIGQIPQAAQVRIDDFLALSANHVGMREWSAAIVPIAPIREPEFQNLTYLFQEGDGLVNGCKTGGGKVGSHFFVNHLDGGVSFAGGQNPENGESLWRDAEILGSKPFEHLIQPCFNLRTMVSIH